MTLVCRSVAEPVLCVSAPVLLILRYGKGKGEKTQTLAKELCCSSPVSQVPGPALSRGPPTLAPTGAATGTCAMIHRSLPFPQAVMERAKRGELPPPKFARCHTRHHR